MKESFVSTWDSVMDSRHNPLRHLDLSSQHYFMQVLAWMWSMVFSLTFFSIFQFGLTWFAHMILIAGAAMTVALFRQAESQQEEGLKAVDNLGHASRCVWKLDTEA